MSPKKETIISSIPNNFPYNITLDKKGNCNDQNISNSTLLLIFPQEEVFEKPDTFINILLELSESTYNFDIKILLSYDGDLNLGNRNITKGSKMFLDSIGNGQTYTTIFINLNHDADRILPGSKGYNAPTWLVKNSYKAFKDHKLLGIFNFGYISYLYKQNLFNEDLYSDWLEAGIPSISIFFDKKTSGDIITDTISQIISDFNPEINISSYTHSIMIPLIKNQVWL